MSYSTSAPPQCVVPRLGSGGAAVWVYTSTDVHTDVDESGYFSNGYDLGMKVGDVVMVSKSSATIGTTVHYVTTVTTNGAATIAPAILA